uniref:Dipeptidylpeptidase IV N-terminal domain-containing protein n=1 Tax=Gossypium raimondii TaxID=29730 RepID=A0A0D2UWC2_GOSRA|nr:hypothetical protein B456_011G207800 [Gossypium raimondii]
MTSNSKFQIGSDDLGKTIIFYGRSSVPLILQTHGLAEYIAQEEMDRKTGYWWSLDGKFITFTEVDYSEIPLFRIMHQVAVLRHTTQPVSKGMRHSLNPRQNGTATYTDKEGIRQ